jgi:PPOX class probable F420-dependent enzyme
MPATQTIPDKVRDLFEEPAVGHVSYLNKRGQIVTFPMWVDYDGEHLLTSSPAGSRKAQSIGKDDKVSVSIVSTKTPWHWLSVSGHVTDVKPDENLEFIDRMSRKYTGQDYQRRSPRVNFTIAIDRVSSSGDWGG